MPRSDRGTGETSPTLANRLDPHANSLNAIRLVLATTVIVSHSWSIGRYGPTPTHGGFAAGGWAVDAFFVLSGYLIAGSRLNNTLVSYLRRRVLRIYPGFLVCLLTVVLVFAPVSYARGHHSLHGYLSTPNTPLSYLWENLGLKMEVGSVAGTPGGGAWAGTLWTLYFEFLCYVIVGLLACWMTFRRRPIVAAVLVVAVTALSLQNNDVVHHSDTSNLVRLLPFFLAGTLLYLLRDRVACVWWLAVPSALALVIVPDAGPRFVVLCALPLGYLLLYLGAVVPVALGRRNDISYGMYVYGWPVEQTVRSLGAISHLWFVILSLVGTLPLATASWYLVERPAMRWRQSKGTVEAAPVLVTEPFLAAPVSTASGGRRA
jgi:peptidoglycan/LPS O-acetylase OafA/YrhL